MRFLESPTKYLDNSQWTGIWKYGETWWHLTNRQVKLHNPVGAVWLQIDLDFRESRIYNFDSANPYRVDAVRLVNWQIRLNQGCENSKVKVERLQAIDHQASALDTDEPPCQIRSSVLALEFRQRSNDIIFARLRLT